ncbi:MAG: hypothetical protein Tsb0020_49310 [Haliangiales bacterium]
MTRPLISHYLVSALLLAAAVLAAAPSAAHADEEYFSGSWPLRLVERPLVLGANMFELRGETLRINMSKDSIGDPISLAPDLFYGVTDKLTVGVTHERGICISGDGCNDTIYDDLGVEVLFQLLRAGSLELAAHGGVIVRSFDPFIAGPLLGVRARVALGNIGVVFDPSLYIGALERDLSGDFVDLPVQLQYQLTHQNALFLRTGINGPLDGFGDNVAVPVGLGAVFVISRRVDVGGEFLFTNLAGNGGGVDGRLLLIRGAVRL